MVLISFVSSFDVMFELLSDCPSYFTYLDNEQAGKLKLSEGRTTSIHLIPAFVLLFRYKINTGMLELMLLVYLQSYYLLFAMVLTSWFLSM